MRNDEELDRKIDVALRSYAEPPSNPEPRAMAAQLLEQVRVERARRTRSWAWLIPATACGLTLLLIGAAWLLRTPRSSRIASIPPVPAVSTRANRPPDSTRSVPVHSLRPVRRAMTDARPLPKLAVFPTPQPLSSQERELLVLVTQTPPAAQKQVLEGQQHFDDPIAISELRIAPLDEGRNQNSNTER